MTVSLAEKSALARPADQLHSLREPDRVRAAGLHLCWTRSGRPESYEMTYVVVESCIKCKFMDCVEVCPVDCFYEGENMLVIHPDECIDCGVCEPECPVEAIKPDTEPDLENLLKLNADFAKIWPNITAKKEPPADAKDWEDVPNKLETQFSPNPGTGD